MNPLQVSSPSINNQGYRALPFAGNDDTQVQLASANPLNSLNNYASQFNQPTPTITSSAPAKKKKGNWFTNSLSTGGSIVGGLLGTLTDPFTFGAGSVLGAAAGSALGKLGENALEGNSADDGLLTSAIEGGAGEFGGKVIGKIGKTVLDKAAPKVVSKLIQGQASKGLLKEGAASELEKAGQVSMKQIGKAAKVLTGVTDGTEGALTKAVTSSLDEAARTGVRAPANGLMELSEKSLANNYGGRLTAAETKELHNSATDAVMNLTEGSGSNIKIPHTKGGGAVDIADQLAQRNVTPNEMLKIGRQFSTNADGFYKTAYKDGQLVSTKDLAKAQYWKDMADEVKGRAFGGTGETAIKIDPATRAQLNTELEAIKTSNPRLYKYIKPKVDNAVYANELSSMQSPFVQGSKAASVMANKASDTGISVGTLLGNGSPLPGMAGTAHSVGAAITNSGASNMIEGGAARAIDAIAGGENPSALGGLLQKTLVPGGGALGALVGTSPNFIQEGSNENLNGVGDTMDDQNAPQGLLSQSTPESNELKKALFLAAVNNPSLMAQITMSGDQIKKSADTKSAQSALSGLLNTYQSAGGGQGTILGTLSKIGGAVSGGSPKAFGEQTDLVANQIAQATGMDPASVKKQFLPSLTDSPQGAANKVTLLKKLLQSTLQGAQQTGISGLGFSGMGTSPTAQQF